MVIMIFLSLDSDKEKRLHIFYCTLCTSNGNRFNEEKWFHNKNARSRRYSVETMADAALLATTTALIEFLKQTVEGIGLYVNANKTDLISFKQGGTISSSTGKLLKLVNQFIYFGSNISSARSDVSINIDKTWTVIDRLMTI